MKVLYASLFVVIADQISKLLVKGASIPFLGVNFKGMRYAESVKIFGDYVKITFVENPGMAFGIEVGESSKLFLSLFSLIASIGIVIYLYKSQHYKFIVRLSLAFILGGAVGNLIDRAFYGIFYDYAPLFYGRVVDFIHVDFFDFSLFGHRFNSFPIFNIADSSVTIGVILLILFHRSIETQEDITAGTEVLPAEGTAAEIAETEPGAEAEDNKTAALDVEDNNRKEV